jgi:hypothetical protein
VARTKPCDFCAQDQIWNETGENGHQLCFEFYPDNGFMAVYSYANDESGVNREIGYDLSVKYCPKCGRKVGVS